jgi:hypothetical protein
VAAPYTFDYGSWVARYPEFSTVQQATAQQYFNEATLYWRNDGTSPNPSAISQQLYLNMLTAHIAALYTQSQGDPSPGSPKDSNSPVGRISSATEGSVTAQVELNMAPTTSGLQAWLSQTKYGLSFRAATRAYWGTMYVPGRSPSNSGGPYGPGFGPGGFGPW